MMRICFLLVWLTALAHATSGGEKTTDQIRAMGVWKGSIAEWDLKSFGADKPDELLLYIIGQRAATEHGGELSVTEADLHLHFQSGSDSTIRCFAPHDTLTPNSISSERERPGMPPVRLELKYNPVYNWAGLLFWRNTPIPITFGPLKPIDETAANHPLVGEWRSTSTDCHADEIFHIALSTLGREIVTYDRVNSAGAVIGEVWDMALYQDALEIIERTDGAFGGSRIFLPEVTKSADNLEGHWIGHNPNLGCSTFVRVK